MDDAQSDFLSRARDTHIRFAFYTTALAFTLLGAATQTVHGATATACSIVIELLGWGALAVSGCLGLTWILLAVKDYYALGGAGNRSKVVAAGSAWSQYIHLVLLALGVVVIVTARAITIVHSLNQ